MLHCICQSYSPGYHEKFRVLWKLFSYKNVIMSHRENSSDSGFTLLYLIFLLKACTHYQHSLKIPIKVSQSKISYSVMWGQICQINNNCLWFKYLCYCSMPPMLFREKTHGLHFSERRELNKLCKKYTLWADCTSALAVRRQMKLFCNHCWEISTSSKRWITAEFGNSKSARTKCKWSQVQVWVEILISNPPTARCKWDIWNRRIFSSYFH